jgi:catechol 2,3-dioxygenase-like lactoylglutathione lyase family enzyme
MLKQLRSIIRPGNVPVAGRADGSRIQVLKTTNVNVQTIGEPIMRVAAAVMLTAGLALANAVFCAESPMSAPITGEPAAGNELGLFVDHVTIGAADLDRLADWYERVLGVKATPVAHRPAYDLRQIFIPGFRIDLLFKKGSIRAEKAPMDNDKQGLVRVAFGAHDIDAAYQRLVAQGVKLEATRNPQGQITSMHFNDPEGNGLEVAKR